MFHTLCYARLVGQGPFKVLWVCCCQVEGFLLLSHCRHSLANVRNKMTPVPCVVKERNCPSLPSCNLCSAYIIVPTWFTVIGWRINADKRHAVVRLRPNISHKPAIRTEVGFTFTEIIQSAHKHHKIRSDSSSRSSYAKLLVHTFLFTASHIQS